MVTFNQIKTELEKLVQLYPDNLYTNPAGGICQYDSGQNSHYPEEGCIFGAVFRNLGIEIPPGKETSDISSVGIFITNDSNEEAFLESIQEYQDTGQTWKDAYLSAEMEYNM